jgi:dihydrofolate reductase
MKEDSMRVVVSEFLSLDGVMEAPDQWQLQNDLFTEDMGKDKHEELFTSDALLLGRVTYEGFAAAWPSRSDEEVREEGGDVPEGFADRMNSLPKYVVSTTLEQGEWNNSTLIKGDVAGEISKLKQERGQDILLLGSADLVNSLMPHRLIDEYRLWVHPVVVGKGKRLFKDEIDETVLKLADTKAFDSGVLALTYKPAG